MFGPLPPLYRAFLCLCTLLAFVGLGAALAVALPVEMLARSGAGIGTALGLVFVVLLLRDTGVEARPGPRRGGSSSDPRARTRR